MSSPLVSIVIPCYNAEQWIAEAVLSGLEQTWPHVEVVVVDDGSTDRSVEKLKEFGDRIRWESGPNRGGCAARNRGIELARGEWIQLLDADDLLTPDCVEGKLKESGAPGERVCCDLGQIDSGVSFELPPWWIQQSWDLDFMLNIGTPQTAAPIHRRSDLLAVGGFREHLPCAQEYDLHLGMAIQQRVRFVSNGRTGVLFRATEGSVSRALGAVNMIKTISTVISDAWDLLEKQPSLADYHRVLVAGHLGRLSRKLYRKGCREEAMFFAARARRISPQWWRGTYQSALAARAVRLIGLENVERVRSLFKGGSPASQANTPQAIPAE